MNAQESNRHDLYGLLTAIFVILGVIAWLFYPSWRVLHAGHEGIGRPIIESDPRRFVYPVCVSNTHPGWGIYRQRGAYTYTLSKPNQAPEKMVGPVPWMQYPELKSLYCEEAQ